MSTSESNPPKSSASAVTSSVQGDEGAVQSSATEELKILLRNENELDPAVLERDIVHEAEGTDLGLNWPVIISAMTIVLGVIVWGLVSPTKFANFASDALSGVVGNFGWAFVLFGTAFVFFIIAIAVSKFGSIRLGRDDEGPEFDTLSWISMMFAAGMGIGLMFYGTTEPLTFYRNGVPGHDKQEVGTAFASTMFHWTLHPWSIYAIVGLAIAYSTFRVGRRQLLSAAFTPLIGEKQAQGVIGKIVDILAIVATIFGTACSLGIGALQIGAGLEASGLIQNPGTKTIVGIVAVLTLAFLISAMSGVGRGIRYLSNTNMILAICLALFVFVLGPTVTILNLIPGNLANYLNQFFEMAGRTAESADGTAGEWLSSWTIFYWAWWISWSPFVGMFVARISRGRTIREFVLGVLAVPFMVTVVWFSIFGGTAIHFEQNGSSIWGEGDAQRQLFDLLHQLPGGFAAGILAMILLSTFFITSADSASTVMGSMSQNGQLEAKPWVNGLWGILTAAIGLTLLISGGDDALSNLQNVTIIAASPFLIIIVGLMFSLLKDLSDDSSYLELKEQQVFNKRFARERRIHAEMLRREERHMKRRQAHPTKK